MCIIIYNKSGVLPHHTLEECADSNPHGMGLMYAIKGRLRVIKELNDFNKFYNQYVKIRGYYSGGIALHFRIKTAGKVNLNNIHPFAVSQNLAFMHNGILPISVPDNSKVSDTIVFNEEILKNLPDNFLDSPGIKTLMAGFIEKDNKLLFMDNTGEVNIINESSGHWVKDNWFSNYSYLRTYYGGAYQHYTSVWDICEFCGETLLYNERLRGICANCIHEDEEAEKKYSEVIVEQSKYTEYYCPYCYNPLTGKEVDREYCSRCFASFDDSVKPVHENDLEDNIKKYVRGYGSSD